MVLGRDNQNGIRGRLKIVPTNLVYLLILLENLKKSLKIFKNNSSLFLLFKIYSLKLLGRSESFVDRFELREHYFG